DAGVRPRRARARLAPEPRRLVDLRAARMRGGHRRQQQRRRRHARARRSPRREEARDHREPRRARRDRRQLPRARHPPRVRRGPQAGILAGKKALVERAKKHPLARAVRIDKLSLAALTVTARLALDPARSSEIPVVRMMFEPAESVRARAKSLASLLEKSVKG